MNTFIVYYDETGDDGISTLSSDVFVLTALYMDTNDWKENFAKIKTMRGQLKEKFGFYISEELHTKHLVRDKGLYRPHGWSLENRIDILREITKCIGNLKLKIVNTIVDKNKIKSSDYGILDKALTYSIQRIENDSAGLWDYIMITDRGRISPMRKTARKIQAYNPVTSHYGGYVNKPINGLIEDILEKDSAESYFIQLCDFVSYFTFLYYKAIDKKEELPKRVGSVIDVEKLTKLFEYLKRKEVLNLKASNRHKFGFVIYPK